MARTYTITGTVRDAKRKPAANMLVEAFDSDMGSADDFLGSAFTDTQGRFRIKFEEKAFKGRYDILEREPDVYLAVSDEYGVVKKTDVRSEASNLKFNVILKDDSPFYDPYANAEQRMIALFASVGDIVDLSLINPQWTATLLLRTITSYLHYTNRDVARLYGYPGAQVIARPKEFPRHDHTIPWRKTK